MSDEHRIAVILYNMGYWSKGGKCSHLVKNAASIKQLFSNCLKLPSTDTFFMFSITPSLSSYCMLVDCTSVIHGYWYYTSRLKVFVETDSCESAILWYSALIS